MNDKSHIGNHSMSCKNLTFKNSAVEVESPRPIDKVVLVDWIGIVSIVLILAIGYS